MASACTEHQHHHHHHNHRIPPRNLLTRHTNLSPDAADYFSAAQSPSKLLHSEASLLQKFLPYNTNLDDAGSGSDSGMDADPYSSDQFRMYEFKVRKCTRSRSHDWTDCPFSHPGEKARRRDPRRFHYSGTVCPEYRRSGSCSRGDECEFAHGVFECWLHPARYRTEACKDGKNCKRKVCFFAHTPRELRVLPPHEDGEERDGKADRSCHGGQHCCRYCCSLSPTSTLLGMSHFSPPMSPTLSPPRSPMKTVGLSGFSPVSRYSDRLSAYGLTGDSLGLTSNINNKGLSYEDMVIAELLGGSMEGMSISDAVTRLKTGHGSNKAPGLWVDVGYDNTVPDNDQHQFTLSPSTSINSSPALSTRNYSFTPNSDSSAYYGHGFNANANAIANADANANANASTNTNTEERGVNETGLPGPDLGWVNDLLM